MRRMALTTLMSLSAMAHADLQAVADEALGEYAGQAFFDLSKQSLAQPGGGKLDFIKLMLGGQMKVNANIGELNLGPTGSEYLKLSNMSLSGGSGPGSVMTLQNPFIEFAMQNDGSASSRRVIGLRLGASNMNGVLGIGIQTNNGTDTGISRFSGYLTAQSAPGSADIIGTAQTAAFNFNKNVTARVYVDNGVNGRFTTDINPDDPGFYVPAQNVAFTVPGGLVVNTTSGPITSIPIGANAIIPDIAVSGKAHFDNVRDKSCPWYNLVICNIVLALVPSANPTINTGISGLGAVFNMQEDLRFIHKAVLSDNGASLSLQSEDVMWPNAPGGVVAKPGWWLGLSNPVNLGTLNVTTPIVITDSVQNQLASYMSTYFTNNPVKLSFSSAVGALLGMDISVPYANLSGNNLSVRQDNLNLGATQTQPGNCYGGRSFC